MKWFANAGVTHAGLGWVLCSRAVAYRRCMRPRRTTLSIAPNSAEDEAMSESDYDRHNYIVHSTKYTGNNDMSEKDRRRCRVVIRCEYASSSKTYGTRVKVYTMRKSRHFACWTRRASPSRVRLV